jgi:hypothetical protein
MVEFGAGQKVFAADVDQPSNVGSSSPHGIYGKELLENFRREDGLSHQTWRVSIQPNRSCRIHLVRSPFRIHISSRHLLYSSTTVHLLKIYWRIAGLLVTCHWRDHVAVLDSLAPHV